MEKFTIEELGYFVSLCGAVVVSCIAIVIKSRCKTIETPCIKCKREVLHENSEQVVKPTLSAEQSNPQIEDKNTQIQNKQNSNPQIEDTSRHDEKKQQNKKSPAP